MSLKFTFCSLSPSLGSSNSVKIETVCPFSQFGAYLRIPNRVVPYGTSKVVVSVLRSFQRTSVQVFAQVSTFS